MTTNSYLVKRYGFRRSKTTTHLQKNKYTINEHALFILHYDDERVFIWESLQERK